MSSSALIRSMLALRSERRTGVLTIDAEGHRTFVYLLEGVPVFAEEGTQGETLGRLLIRQRKLTQEQYAHIIQKMTEALVINEQLRFGELAVELGYLDEAQVRKALVDQMRWKIVRVFQRGDVAWTFEDSASRLEDVGRFPMRIEALVLDAVRWIDDEQKAAMGLGAALDSSVHLERSEVDAVAERFELTSDELPMLRILDGRTVRAVLEAKEAKDIDAPAVMTALLVTRAVTTATEPRLARPATPVVEIRVQKITVRREIEPASPPPQPVANPVAPEASKPPEPAKPKIVRPKLTRASKILASLEERRVKVDIDRAPENEHEAKLLAEQALQTGLPHLRAGRYQQALPDVTRAAQLLPSEEYKLYARWCSVKAAGNPALHANERAELRKLAMGATKADPNFAFGFYVAGACALDEGDAESAFRLLDRAVKIDPGIPDANRLHRMAKRDGDKGGLRALLSRDLFGKKKD